MSELAVAGLDREPETGGRPETEGELGKVTVLEALAEATEAVSIDMSRMSTQMGNGVDAEDD